MSFECWFMLPVAIGVATVAMASGVGEATFFAPIFRLALRLSPEVAIGTGLIIEVFGFLSRLSAYARKKLIDYKLGLTLLAMGTVTASRGTWIAGLVEPTVLKVILGVGILFTLIAFWTLGEVIL